MTKDRIDEIIEALKSINYICEKKNKIFVEVLVFLNGSDQKTFNKFVGLLSEMKFEHFDKLIFHHSPKNLGVAGGRNFLFRKSIGDIIIFIDDDAEILTDRELFWEVLFKDFFSDEYYNVGALAFKSIGTDNMPRLNEIPAKVENSKMYVSNFIGVAHAILRKSVKENSFLYPEALFYGMEEYYLSYYIINNGYSILYDPRLIVKHKKSPKTRLGNIDYYVFLSSNKVYIYFLIGNFFQKVSSFVLWSGWLLIKTRFKFRAYFKFLKRLVKLLMDKRNKRYKFKLSKQAKYYIKKTKGSYYY